MTADRQSLPGVRHTPRRITPRDIRLDTRGPRAAQLLTRLGVRPLPWQRAALDVALEVDSRGRYVHRVVVILVPRRAGKTLVVAGALTDRSLFTPGGACYYTAQRGTEAARWFRQDYLPMLRPLAGGFKQRLSTGREMIEWRNGSMVGVFSPTKDALHGRFSDLVVLDESWAFDPTRGAELLQGIRPTQATRPGSQTWIVSAAGDAESAFLRAQVEAGRAAVESGDPTVALIEYGVPDDADPTDPAVVARYHPAVGHTIDPEFVNAERILLGPAEFARAYGCWSPPAETAATEVDPAAWAAAADPTPMPASLPVAVGFDVGPGRDWAVVAAAKDGAGKIWLDVIDIGPPRTDRRLVDLLHRLYADQRPRPAIGVDDAGPARSAAETVEQAGTPLHRLSGRDYAAACTAFADAVNAGRIRHRGQPELDAAVAALATRPLADSWAWSRRRATSTISAAVAATVAAWTLDTAPKLVKPVVISR